MGRDRAAAPSVHRLSRDVTQLLLHQASLPSREIEDAAEWMVRTIVRRIERSSKARIEPLQHLSLLDDS
jgi:hypothetical protein